MTSQNIIFPFRCEEFILNDKRYIKFTHLQTNLYSLQPDNRGIFILFINEEKFIIVKNNIYDNFDYYYHYDITTNVISSINQYNITNQFVDKNLDIFRLLNYINTNNKQTLFNNKIELNSRHIYLCEINKTSLDLSGIQQYISELNQILHLHCFSKYFVEINYAYLMNNVLFYNEEDPDAIVLCMKINNKCVSSIELLLEKNDSGENIYYLRIDSKTLSEFEGNKLNQILRLIVMIISQFFPIKITHIHSQALNPISAYLMIKLFKNNDYDGEFYDYLQKKQITHVTYQIIDEYINSAQYISTDSESESESDEDTDTEINIYSPVNELNIHNSYQMLYEFIKNLPCEKDFAQILHHLDPQFQLQQLSAEEIQKYFSKSQIGGRIENKCNKYISKIKYNFSDIYFDKLLFWNTVKIIITK